ncbi:MAG: hypothetical protein QOE70_5167 [Chthoniobacter sp.]|jgi:hypothetical protein|nr:hypothetical protein [Chthoniobacter sp.]
MAENASPGDQSVCQTFYHPDLAKIREDGTIVMQAGGCNEHGIWDGYFSVPADSPDYKFWLWTVKQKDRWTGSWLTSENLRKVLEEYSKTVD